MLLALDFLLKHAHWPCKVNFMHVSLTCRSRVAITCISYNQTTLLHFTGLVRIFKITSEAGTVKKSVNYTILEEKLLQVSHLGLQIL